VPVVRALRVLLGLALVVAVALLAGGNVTPVTLDYVAGQVRLPLAVALFGALVLGVLLGWAATYVRVVRLRVALRRARAAAQAAEAGSAGGSSPLPAQPPSGLF
jgi:uncharacterized integral membrane protein